MDYDYNSAKERALNNFRNTIGYYEAEDKKAWDAAFNVTWYKALEIFRPEIDGRNAAIESLNRERQEMIDAQEKVREIIRDFLQLH
jgi:hypothetical protein